MDRGPVRLDLWLWRLKGGRGDAALMSPDEHARAARFAFQRHRAAYIAGRAHLRRVLGRYLGQPPQALRFRYGAHGKPALDGLSFNLSHGGDLAALVVTRAELALGIDIEPRRKVEPGLARTHFAPDELAALHALPDATREAGFFTLWTRKEAYLKACGLGLSAGLSGFSVPLDAAPARMIRSLDARPDQWLILDAPPAPGFSGAIVVKAGPRPVTLHHCPEPREAPPSSAASL
ncbi:MAG: 4'-phosphopantetheinyl transferase superfamily protein [Paracoccus sp. (in: a-proteobacteria)]|nr:4'-phosphopantetheinyl transferase superfamily protein [Paracoccus sp. (in: a-proteobacteria)]